MNERREERSESGKKETSGLDFIRTLLTDDRDAGRHEGRVHTRFPPEPNGYLHIGHAKAICLNFGVAQEFAGLCNLRFDDTNPLREDVEYVDSIIEDVRWLGFDWEDRLYYASDYFDQLYEWALQLVRDGKAYVDSIPAQEVGSLRGAWHEEGAASPFRERSVEENLDLFRRMKAGEFADGAHVLRARIDMGSGNMNLRDPVMYRIRHAHHHRTGDSWCIYPNYDWAHGQSDAIEGITHSFCTLEFEDHRPLYDWFLDQVEPEVRPRQVEFARLDLSYTVLSKRKLLELVESGAVDGWDDPRMPTLAGLRRRGYTPHSIRDLCDRVGVTKRKTVVDLGVLEHCLREELNRSAERRMAVLRPLKVVLTNYPEEHVDELQAINNPEDESAGSRPVPFSREIYIEREDFLEDPPRKFFRLAPGREVRLRYGYMITCQEVVKDETGEVVELRCTYDPETRGGTAPDGRRVKATLHWVSARHALDAEVRLYDRLFDHPNPAGEGAAWKEQVNPSSLEVLRGCKLEPALAAAAPGERYQFERQGYFCLDRDSTADALVFNRAVSLRDSWARLEKQLAASGKKS